MAKTGADMFRMGPKIAKGTSVKRYIKTAEVSIKRVLF